MTIVGLIQARMGSTRLPGKVLLDLAGEPMLARVVNRSHRAEYLDKIVVATTTNPIDKVIVELCTARGWHYFCGSEDNVLDRYYRAALTYQADVVVRITADCPLIAPVIINQAVGEFLDDDSLDFASTRLSPRTFPRGQEVDVISLEALERAWLEDDNPTWREHVTPYIYRHPKKFEIKAVVNKGRDYSRMRWTVDTIRDLEFVRRIYDHFGHDDFSWHEVLALLEQHPEWLKINQHIVQKEVFDEG